MSDLIDRDEVIEYCLKLIDVERKQGTDVMNYGQERINQTDTIIAFVENLPSARPKGEWMPYEAYLGKDREYSVTEHKCSLCGYLWGEPEYRYCPNCGADMRGERADEHGRNKSADRQ